MKIALILVCLCAVAGAQSFMACGASCSESPSPCPPPSVNNLPNCETTACTLNPTSDQCYACYADTLQADEAVGTCLTGNAECLQTQMKYYACSGYNDGLMGCVLDLTELASIGELGLASQLWLICTSQLQDGYDTQIDDAVAAYNAAMSAATSTVGGLTQGAGSALTGCLEHTGN